MQRVSKARTEIVQARVDAELKALAVANLDRLGLSVSEFIRLKIAEIAHSDGLHPNQKTLEAITRLNRGEGRRYSSSDEMFKELDKL